MKDVWKISYQTPYFTVLLKLIKKKHKTLSFISRGDFSRQSLVSAVCVCLTVLPSICCRWQTKERRLTKRLRDSWWQSLPSKCNTYDWGQVFSEGRIRKDWCRTLRGYFLETSQTGKNATHINAKMLSQLNLVILKCLWKEIFFTR